MSGVSTSLVDELLLHYRDLRHHLVNKLRNTEDAADIAQTSFEHVYARAQRPSALDEVIESPRALLFRVAHNLIIDQARHRKVVQAWEEERFALQASLAAPSSETLYAQRQLVERVVAQLETLPPRRREVFLLFRAYGHSQAEIAQRLGITEAAVAKHVVRATVDCARIFAHLRAELPGSTDPAAGPGASPLMAEDAYC